MTIWRHRSKGLIEGVELVNLGPDDTWMRVRLDRDHRLAWLSPGRASRGEVTPEGEVLTLRRSFMHPITDKEEAR